MQRAQKRDASRNTRFWFRRAIYPPGEERQRNPDHEVDLPTPPSERVNGDDLEIRPRHAGDCGSCKTHQAFFNSTATGSPSAYEEMTMDEIINGKVTNVTYKGFKPIHF